MREKQHKNRLIRYKQVRNAEQIKLAIKLQIDTHGSVLKVNFHCSLEKESRRPVDKLSCILETFR